MGIYLTLIITNHENEKSFLQAGEVQERMRLVLDQDYEFFGYFEQVTYRPFPKYSGLVIWDDDGGLTSVKKDPMGNKLLYFLAGDFKGKRLPQRFSPMNRAAFAYLRALPEDFPVVLWWY